MKIVLLILLALLVWVVVRAVRNGRGGTHHSAVGGGREGKLAADLAHHSRQGLGQTGANGPGGFAG